MKTKTLFLFLLSILAGSIFAQTTWTVENTPGALQSVINNASPGDILLLQGSSTSYGTITLNKLLTLKGPGYYLGANPNTQVQFMEAGISSFTLVTGAEGSVIMGLTFENQLVINTSDILVTKSKINTIVIDDNVYSVIVNRNYIDRFYSGNTVIIGDNCSDIQFKNNYIDKFTGNSSSILTVEHNYIYEFHFGYIHSSLIQNNTIYIGTSWGSQNNNSIQYNIFISSLPPTFACCNNFQAAATDLFIDSSDPRYSIDGKYILKAGSLAAGAGVNGVDICMYGGSDPYVLSGIPDIPNIYQLVVPVTGYSNEGINVDIKVKANK